MCGTSFLLLDFAVFGIDRVSHCRCLIIVACARSVLNFALDLKNTASAASHGLLGRPGAPVGAPERQGERGRASLSNRVYYVDPDVVMIILRSSYGTALHNPISVVAVDTVSISVRWCEIVGDIRYLALSGVIH